MALGTFYTYPENPRVYKALIVAKYNGLDAKIDEKFLMNITNNTDEWKAKYGTSQIPAFEFSDGTILFESGVIANYFAHLKEDSPLVGKTKLEEAYIQQWIQYVDYGLMPYLQEWVLPHIGIVPYNKAVETMAIERVRTKIAALEYHLLKHTYFVGERVTLADISNACSLIWGFKMFFDADFRKEFPAVTRWFTTIVNQPHVKAVLGDFAFCETCIKFVAPAKEKKAAKEDKKPKTPKEPKQKPKKEVEEEQEEKFEDAPKPKSKLDLLPVAKMPLDEWKRQYSNNDTPVAMKWLWENIDLTADYSIWKVDYKYNDELTKIYMSNNLAGGLLNRLERARKYAFGCLVVAGEDNANIITGYFIIRGNADEMIEEVTDAADYESYTWVKVNVDDAEKAKINQIFAWEGVVDGKPIQDGKVFK
ncbi:hypothetical protein BGZ94_005353 [Podila epigama]|nr:hypothetical protein BGZ94_005353 [Podila epigama]